MPSNQTGQVNNEFIDALVQQAQPPHVRMSEFQVMQMEMNNVGSDDEDVDNILDEEDEFVIKNMMMKTKITADGIEKKLNEEDDYDEGYNAQNDDNVLREDQEVVVGSDALNHLSNKSQHVKNEKSVSRSFVIHGSDESDCIETTK